MYQKPRATIVAILAFTISILLTGCGSSTIVENNDDWEWEIPSTWEKERYTDESYLYTTNSGSTILLYETDFYDTSKSDDVLDSFVSHNKHDKVENGDSWVEYEYSDITYGAVGSYDFVYQDCEKTYSDGRVEQSSCYAAFVGEHHFVNIWFSTFKENDETVNEYIDALNSIKLV